MHASEGSTNTSVFNDVELCPVLVNFLFDVAKYPTKLNAGLRKRGGRRVVW